MIVRCSLSAAARAAGLAVAVSALSALSPPAIAHPHIWVTTRAEVVVENGAIVAIRHNWIFDEYYSRTAIDGLDAHDEDHVRDLFIATPQGAHDTFLMERL